MNRTELQQLAEDRLLDAHALLAANRWSGAYYLARYALECGLKACVIRYMIESGADFLFRDKKFSEKCWTHDLSQLVLLAGLKISLDKAGSLSPRFLLNWQTADGWKETSRYKSITSIQAQELYDAIADPNEGVLQWVRAN